MHQKGVVNGRRKAEGGSERITNLFKTELPILIFASADVALCEAAQNERLSVDNPNEH